MTKKREINFTFPKDLTIEEFKSLVTDQQIDYMLLTLPKHFKISILLEMQFEEWNMPVCIG